MKTAEEFVKEIKASEELQNALKEIKEVAALEEFLKKNDCGATVAEFAKCATAQGEGEICDDEAEGAAGGVDDIWWNPFAVKLPRRGA